MARSKSRNRRRRNSLPNSMLPTSFRRRDTLSTIARLSSLLSPTRSFDFWDEDMPVVRHVARPIPKRQLATEISKFPKSYGVREPVHLKNVKAVTTAPDVLPVCAQRSIREEVIHAIGKAGKAGQKSPRWTKKSKVRC